MTDTKRGANTCYEAEYFTRLFRKLLEDAEEAYYRTPVHVSSRPYMERVLRLVQAGLSESIRLLSECKKDTGDKRSA